MQYRTRVLAARYETHVCALITTFYRFALSVKQINTATYFTVLLQFGYFTCVYQVDLQQHL